MSYSYAEKKRIRKEFGVLPHILDVPYLLSVQTSSYKRFLMTEEAKDGNSGLETVLKQTFPIESKNGQYELFSDPHVCRYGLEGSLMKMHDLHE